MVIWWVLSFFLAVPILVHLFDFRRAKKLYFSTIKYIDKLSSKTKSKSRLKYLLVLGNRILIFCCVLFCLWQMQANDAKIDGPVFLYYDNSISSSSSNGNLVLEETVQSLLDRGLKPISLYDNLNSQQVASLSDLLIPHSYVSLGLSRFFSNELKRDGSSLFISDFQLIDVQELQEFNIDSTQQYDLVLLNDLNDDRNVFVDSLWVEVNPTDLSKLSIFVDFVASNAMDGNLVVKLMQEGRQLSSVVKNVEELDVVEFDVPIDEYGQYSLMISGDDVLYDNEFFFIREVSSKPAISILNNGDTRAIEQVFNNAALFETEILDIQNLDYELMSTSDLIVFNAFTELPSNLIEQFADKHFLIFPSDSIGTHSYDKLEGLSFSSRQADNLQIDMVDGNLLMRGIFEKNASPGSLPILVPTFNVQGSYEPIINYRDNSPFLLVNENKYVFNTALNTASGFETNALFLPILYQIAFSSVGGIEVPYVYPGNTIELNVSTSDTPIRIVKGGFEVIPTFNSSGSQTAIQVPENIDPGFYYLIQEEDTLRQIAINIPKEESVMISPTLEELKLVFEKYENVNVSEAYSGSENTVFATAEPVGLWKYALILAILLVLTETMLHRYFR
jgi:hypothetical protein